MELAYLRLIKKLCSESLSDGHTTGGELENRVSTDFKNFSKTTVTP
jgi:hypothetical protein